VCVCVISETGGEYCRAVLMLHNSPVHGIVLFATAASPHRGLTMNEWKTAGRAHGCAEGTARYLWNLIEMTLSNLWCPVNL